MNSDMFIFTMCFGAKAAEEALNEPCLVSSLGERRHNIVRFIKHCLNEASKIQSKYDFCRASGLSVAQYDKFIQLRDAPREEPSETIALDQSENMNNLNSYSQQPPKMPPQQAPKQIPDRTIDQIRDKITKKHNGGSATCNICGKSFSSNYKLIRHSVKHTGIHPFICGVCGKGFSERYLLTKHELTHNQGL